MTISKEEEWDIENLIIEYESAKSLYDLSTEKLMAQEMHPDKTQMLPEDIKKYQNAQVAAEKEMRAFENKIKHAQIDLRQKDTAYSKNYFQEQLRKDMEERQNRDIQTQNMDAIQSKVTQDRLMETASVQEKKQHRGEALKEAKKEPELSKEEIVNSDLSWEEKKEMFTKVYEQEKKKEKEQALTKDEDELEL